MQGRERAIDMLYQPQNSNTYEERRERETEDEKATSSLLLFCY